MTSTFVPAVASTSTTVAVDAGWDVYLDVHLANLNGLTPTGSVYGVAIVNGEALVHINTSRTHSNTTEEPVANCQLSNEFIITYSGDHNFAAVTWDMLALTASSAAHPTVFLTPNPIAGHGASPGSTSPSAANGAVWATLNSTDVAPAVATSNTPPALVLAATVAPFATSNSLLVTVGDITTGPTGASGIGSPTSSVPQTVVTPSSQPDPTRDLLDTAIFGDLGQDFWLSLRSVTR